MFLDLDIPDDDPLRPAKIYVSKVAPGFRIFEKDGNIEWESDFVWLVVVNEEDGLDFYKTVLTHRSTHSKNQRALDGTVPCGTCRGNLRSDSEVWS